MLKSHIIPIVFEHDGEKPYEFIWILRLVTPRGARLCPRTCVVERCGDVLFLDDPGAAGGAPAAPLAAAAALDVASRIQSPSWCRGGLRSSRG